MRRAVIHLVSFCLLAGACLAQAEANEKAVWSIWKMVESGTNAHSAVIAACEKFREDNPNDPLVEVTRGFAAWHLLKAGNRPAAAGLLTAMEKKSATPLESACAEMARTWLTRIEMENVKLALTKVHRRDIEYPESLDALTKLPEGSRPRMTDRWGKRWTYSLVGFNFLEGFRNQKYKLQSRALGEDSDLAEALELPYAGRINLRPVRTSSPESGLIMFMTTNGTEEKVMLSEKVSSGNTVLAYSGNRILILSDGNHWKLTGKPQR